MFYEPAFALAAAPAFGRDAGAVLVWSAGRPAGRPVPARIERHRYGVPLRVLAGWTHPYAPLGTPLVDRDDADAVIAALLDHLGNRCHPAEAAAAAASRRGWRRSPPRSMPRSRDAACARRRSTAISARCSSPTTDARRLSRAPRLGKKRRQGTAAPAPSPRRGNVGDVTCDDRKHARHRRRDRRRLPRPRGQRLEGPRRHRGRAAPANCRLLSAAVAGLAAEGKALAGCLRRDGRAIAAIDRAPQRRQRLGLEDRL